MSELDNAIKELFQGFGGKLAERVGGAPHREWLNVELPRTNAPRVDLVAWLANDTLLHVEFQRTNDPSMPVRMLEYRLALYRRFQVHPKQVVLFFGNDKLTMARVWKGPGLRYEYGLLDARDLDADELLESDNVGEVLLAILSGKLEPRERIRRILERLKPLKPEVLVRALRLLLILSTVRGVVKETVEEARLMSLDFDPREDPYIRELFEREQAQVIQQSLQKGLQEGLQKGLQKGLEKGLQKGLEKGLQEGRQEGLQKGLEKGLEKGRVEGSARLLRRALKYRFRTLPKWADERLQSASETQISIWMKRLLEANKLEDVFGRSRTH